MKQENSKLAGTGPNLPVRAKFIFVWLMEGKNPKIETGVDKTMPGMALMTQLDSLAILTISQP